MPRLPFRVFNLVSFFLNFLEFCWLSLNCIFCFFQFDKLRSFLDEFAFLLDTLLSFLMHFHFSLLDLTHFFDEMYLTFSFPHLPQLDWISSLDESSFLIILLNLNDLSWNLISLMSFDKSISSHNLMKILAFNSLSLFLLLKSFLAWWRFHIVWYFLKILSLLDGFPSYLAWWGELSLFFDELSSLNLINLPLLNLSYWLHWGPYQVVLNP